MEHFNSYDEFKKELDVVYDKINSIEGFQVIFNSMAKFALTNLAIKVGNIKYYLLEIEFYYCNKLLEDKESFKRTYKRDCEAGELFLHYSGLDFCFATSKDNNSYGGILIRSVLKHEDGKKDEIIPGPLRCANEIINQCFKNKEKPHPEIIQEKNRIQGKINATIRQGIETGKFFEKMRNSDEELPRFAYYIEGIEWPKNYSANPSASFNKDKKETREQFSYNI